MQVAGDDPSGPGAQVAGKPLVPPLDPGVRDSRKVVLSPRAASLIVKEQQGLESLFVSIAKSDPDRPRLIRRIAEGFVELANAEAREQKGNAEPARVERAKKVERAARLAAIKYYKALEGEYPGFCYPKSGPEALDEGCLDEALYFMGLEYEALGDNHEARKAYFNLVKTFPKSPLLPYAYLAFGELFLKEVQADPGRWSLALQSYEEAAKVKGSPVAAVARGRVALACETMGAGDAEPELCARLGAGGMNVAE